MNIADSQMKGKEAKRTKEQTEEKATETTMYVPDAEAAEIKATRAFAEIAGRIVDSQIEWKPSQNGRWQLEFLKDGTPIIRFHDFPADTLLVLRSNNGNVVTLGLKAAAAAISQAAHNWVSWSAHEQMEKGNGTENFEAISRQADTWFNAMTHHIFRTRQFTKDEQSKIYWYND